MKKAPYAGLTLIAISALLIGFATLTPVEGSNAASGSLCLFCRERSLRDLLLNVALFVPLGLGIRLLGATPAKVGALCLLLSLALEGLQLRLPGRFASAMDVATNCAGGLAGALLATYLPILTAPSRRRARLLALVSALTWGAVNFVSAWALAPDGPPTAQYYGQRAHLLPGRVAFRGTVIEATTHGEALPWPDERVAETGVMRSRILREGHQLSVEFTGVKQTEGLAQIAALVDGEDHFLIALDQRGCDLLLSARVRGERLGLGGPRAQVTNACGTAGDTVVVSGMLTGKRLELAQRGGKRSVTASLVMSPGKAWILLSPYPAMLGYAALWTSLWYLCLLLPMGFWVACGWPEARGRAAAVVVLLAGITEWTAAVTFGSATPPLFEWTLIAVSVCLGMALTFRSTSFVPGGASPG